MTRKEPRKSNPDVDWDDVMMEALRASDNGNNPFYADDPDTVNLARELGDAVRATLTGEGAPGSVLATAAESEARG